MAVNDMVTIEKRRVNVFNIVGFFFVIATNIVGGTTIWVNTTRDIREVRQELAELADLRRIRTAATDARLEALTQRIAPLVTLEYRLGQSEARDVAQDQRIDRIVSSFGDKLDALITVVNQVKVDVGVLSADKRSALGSIPPQLAGADRGTIDQ